MLSAEFASAGTGEHPRIGDSFLLANFSVGSKVTE